MVLPEYIPHQPLTFTLAELATHTSHNASGILTPVLQYRQGIVDIWSDIRLAYQSNQTTHCVFTS
jgi:hypothetical protein